MTATCECALRALVETLAFKFIEEIEVGVTLDAVSGASPASDTRVLALST